MHGVAMRWLVGYYGVFQAGHVVLNVVHLSGLRPIQDFPPPRAEGWHPQATAFLTASGLIDTASALLALYFVAAFFGGRRRALWAGLVSLTTSMWVRLFFVGGPISLSGGGEAGGNWIRQGVVRSGGGSGGRRYFCRQRPMGDFRWSSRAS